MPPGGIERRNVSRVSSKAPAEVYNVRRLLAADRIARMANTRRSRMALHLSPGGVITMLDEESR